MARAPIFACIIKYVDTIAAIEYFCVRLSSLKTESFFVATRDEQVVKLTRNDAEATEPFPEPTKSIFASCLWVALQQTLQ